MKKIVRDAWPITIDREVDGRWIAVIEAIPGCMVYGVTEEEAIAKAIALAEDVERSKP